MSLITDVGWLLLGFAMALFLTTRPAKAELALAPILRARRFS